MFRAHDLTEQLAIINHFPAYIDANPNAKIIIIDSIAFHFRQDIQNTATRSRVLSGLAQLLNELAFRFGLMIEYVYNLSYLNIILLEKYSLLL